MSQFDADSNDSYFAMGLKTLVGVVLIVASPFIAYSVFKNMTQGNKSRHWQETTVTIIKSQVRADHAGRGTSFIPDVSYHYQHNGKTYRGNRIKIWGSGEITHSAAEKVCQKYALNTTHKGYFDPENPDQAVLIKGAGWLSYLLIWIPFCTLPGGYIMVKENMQAFKEKRRLIKKGNTTKRNRKRPARTRSEDEDFDEDDFDEQETRKTSRRRPSQQPPRQSRRRPRRDS